MNIYKYLTDLLDLTTMKGQAQLCSKVDNFIEEHTINNEIFNLMIKEYELEILNSISNKEFANETNKVKYVFAILNNKSEEFINNYEVVEGNKRKVELFNNIKEKILKNKKSLTYYISSYYKDIVLVFKLNDIELRYTPCVQKFVSYKDGKVIKVYNNSRFSDLYELNDMIDEFYKSSDTNSND